MTTFGTNLSGQASDHEPRPLTSSLQFYVGIIFPKHSINVRQRFFKENLLRITHFLAKTRSAQNKSLHNLFIVT